VCNFGVTLPNESSMFWKCLKADQVSSGLVCCVSLERHLNVSLSCS
jgi:hypothetical protein